MSYLTITGRLFLLHLTRPVTHVCYNISYNTIYYYIIVRCYQGGMLELAIKGKYQITEQEIKLTNTILSYTTIV